MHFTTNESKEAQRNYYTLASSTKRKASSSLLLLSSFCPTIQTLHGDMGPIDRHAAIKAFAKVSTAAGTTTTTASSSSSCVWMVGELVFVRNDKGKNGKKVTAVSVVASVATAGRPNRAEPGDVAALSGDGNISQGDGISENSLQKFHFTRGGCHLPC